MGSPVTLLELFSSRDSRDPDGGEVCRAWTGNDAALMLEAGGGWKGLCS